MSSDIRSKAETVAAQTRFLDAYKQIGSITRAAVAAQVGRRTHYDWLESDPEYAQAFEDASEHAIDALELEARRRALKGVTEDVYYKGRVVGQKKVVSDTLLIFLLKGARPEKYKDRQHIEHTGKGGGAIEHQHSTMEVLKHASDEELKVLEAVHRRALAAAAQQLPTPNSQFVDDAIDVQPGGPVS